MEKVLAVNPETDEKEWEYNYFLQSADGLGFRSQALSFIFRAAQSFSHSPKQEGVQGPMRNRGHTNCKQLHLQSDTTRSNVLMQWVTEVSPFLTHSQYIKFTCNLSKDTSYLGGLIPKQVLQQQKSHIKMKFTSASHQNSGIPSKHVKLLNSSAFPEPCVVPRYCPW